MPKQYSSEDDIEKIQSHMEEATLDDREVEKKKKKKKKKKTEGQDGDDVEVVSEEKPRRKKKSTPKEEQLEDDDEDAEREARRRERRAKKKAAEAALLNEQAANEEDEEGAKEKKKKKKKKPKSTENEEEAEAEAKVDDGEDKPKKKKKKKKIPEAEAAGEVVSEEEAHAVDESPKRRSPKGSSRHHHKVQTNSDDEQIEEPPKRRSPKGSSRRHHHHHEDDEEEERHVEAPPKSSSRRKQIEEQDDDDNVVEEAPKKRSPKAASRRYQDEEKRDIPPKLEQKKTQGIPGNPLKSWDDENTETYLNRYIAIQSSEMEMSERVEALRKILYGPVPGDVTLCCHVDRNYDEAGNLSYSLILPIDGNKREDDRRMILMMAKNKSTWAKPTFVLSLDTDDFHHNYQDRSNRYFGKLQSRNNSVSLRLRMSNTVKFVLYDDGCNKSKVYGSHSEIRKEYASIICAAGAAAESQVTVALPAQEPKANAELSDAHAYCMKARINDYVEEVEDMYSVEKSYTYLNKVPLGRNKRIKLGNLCKFPIAPSSKNLELRMGGKSHEETEPCFSFARIGNERFFLAIRGPLSPMQAFAIALAQCQYTKNCKRLI